MRLRDGSVFELARGLDDDVGADLSPLELLRVAGLECLDAVPVDDERALFCTALVEDAALAGVILGEIGGALEIARVVDGDDLDIGVLFCNAERQTADAPKTVDTDSDSHEMLPLQVARR